MTVRRTSGTVSAIKPLVEVVSRKKHTTTADAVNYLNTIRDRRVVESDHVFAQLRTLGTGSRTILTARAQKGSVRLEFSNDPSTNHVVEYIVLREVSQTPQSDGAPVRTAGG